MKYVVVLLVTLSSTLALAYGDDGVFDRGNGGDVVVCTKSDGEKTYELLDLHEQAKGGFTPYVFSSGLPYQKVVDLAIERIGERLPEIADELHIEFERLKRSLYFVDDGQLPEVRDEGSYSIPKNCLLRQLAVQWGPESFYGRIYVINDMYFELLDNHNKAALILHELVYRLYSKYHPDEPLTSTTVRAYVGFFLSEELNHIGVSPFPGNNFKDDETD